MRPAADGNQPTAEQLGALTRRQLRLVAAARTEPVKPGLTFHGLRHSHKTWMIADQIPDIEGPEGFRTAGVLVSYAALFRSNHSDSTSLGV
jgi:integrase